VIGRGVTLRFLFAFVGGRGHLDPLLPMARAAQSRDHTVAFTCSRSMVETVRREGFETVADPAVAEPIAIPIAAPAEPGPLLRVDRTREERDLREKFAGEGARTEAARVLRTAPVWRADVVVCDEVDLGAVIGAERLGLPCATLVVLPAGGMLRPDVVAATLDDVRAEHGLPSDPDMALARGGLVIDPARPGYRDPRDPLPGSTVRIALTRPRAGAATLLPWEAVRPDGPAVYVTLGTVFPGESGDLLARLLAAFDDHPGDVLLTVGSEIDPASYGPVSRHIHVERFVAQARVLPNVAVVVSHGGSGTVLGALAHGRPMVLLPIGADQPWNGDRCVAIGVARVLDSTLATAADIRMAVRDVLADPALKAAAETACGAMLAMPPPAAAVDAIENLVNGRTR
jgi:UDP:flavonoid glycosyltransferase YjiC (YdhE family)